MNFACLGKISQDYDATVIVANQNGGIVMSIDHFQAGYVELVLGAIIKFDLIDFPP